MKDVKGVVFDFGGVMTSCVMPDRVRPIVRELGIPWEALEQGFVKYRRRMDGGFMSMDEMYARIWSDAGVTIDAETQRRVREADMASFLYPNLKTLAWMRSLKERGYKIGILTNMPPEMAPEFRRTFVDFISLADAMVISGEERMYKPMREIYDLLRERIGLPCSELCFIDDNEANCQGARDAGWKALRFLDNDQVERDFEEIRIIALDLDGTLLDSQKHLSERNRAALAKAAEQGMYIVPTTGRFFGMMPAEIRDLPFVRYAITINGAEVYDRETKTAIVREEIPLKTALEIMELLDGYDVIYDCYRCDWGWMTAALQEKAADYATDEHYLKMVREFRKGAPELKAYLRETAAEGDVQKIMLFSRLDASLDVLDEIRAEVTRRFPNIKVTSSTRNNLELNIETANKGQALTRFAEHLGMTIKNCAAFGDGLNDLSMVEVAGFGVAMENAVDEVKDVASWIAPSNDDDGVAAVVETLLV